MPPKRVQTLTGKDVLQMVGLGGLSTPRQAPIRAGDRKTNHSNLQEELKSFVVGHMAAYRYSRLEAGQGWTLKALLRPYEACIKALIGSLEPLAVHPWGL